MTRGFYAQSQYKSYGAVSILGVALLIVIVVVGLYFFSQTTKSQISVRSPYKSTADSNINPSRQQTVSRQ